MFILKKANVKRRVVAHETYYRALRCMSDKHFLVFLNHLVPFPESRLLSR